MNKLKELYKEISSSIWDRIPFSYNIGFRYSEVTITENLLFDIHKDSNYTDVIDGKNININKVEKLANETKTQHNYLYSDVNNTLKPKINSINDRVTALENASQS